MTICDRIGCDERATVEITRWADGIRTCPAHYPEALSLGGVCMIGGLPPDAEQPPEGGRSTTP